MAFFLGPASPATAQTHSCSPPLNLSCGIQSCRSPASGVPAQLWGELQPVDTGELPPERDTTGWSEYSPPPSQGTPRWMSLDIENGYLFAATNWGLETWSLADPAAPVRVDVLGAGAFPRWILDPHEGHPVRDVDAPQGNNNVVAATVTSGGGLAIFDASDKTNLTAKYGDTGKTAVQVYAARIGSIDYSFTASQDGGLLVHNMTAAAALSNLCLEDTPSQQSCGVYVGKLGSRNDAVYVDGAGNAAGSSQWVAFSSAGNPDGLEVWNVSNPASPLLALTALTGNPVHGLALWRSGTSYFLGLRLSTGSAATEGRIYNVSCIATGGCGSLGSPLWSQQLPANVGEYFVTYSETTGRRFLYFGSANKCFQGPQGEWLFDVTNPSQTFDITPPAQVITVFGQPQLTGYWGWYYRRNPTGYNRVMPRMGKFHPNQPYFYRAAYSIFDIHQLTGGVEPTASFSYQPATVYRGQAIAFTDLSSGQPDTWDWTFQDATPATSTAENPAGVVFNSTGAKTVGLTVANAIGSSTTSQTVNVLDPAAQVGGVTASPNPAFVCQPVTFTATGVAGNPAPALAWVVKNSAAAVVASGGNVNPFVWSTSGATAAGAYTATVTASNASGTASATSPAVNIQALPALPASGAFAPTNDAFAAGTVQFHLSVPGATEWRWTFGDGTVTGWLNDPVAGPNPSHAYTQIGSYDVTVEVRNCVETTPRTSSVLTVDVVQITPLSAHFQATQGVSCFGVGVPQCYATVNSPVTFTDSSTGDPDFYDYDWNGDGSFEDANHTAPVTSHTYTSTVPSPGVAPQLRIRRGPEEDIYPHGAIIVDAAGPGPGPGPNPSIAVSGPTTGQVNQALTFTASALNCSPAPAGWSWSATGGGTITGSGVQVSVTWSSAGAKTVSASNPSCGSALGSRNVTITTPGGGGGNNLDARFSFTPANPEVGEEVIFDASTSAGSPQSYSWSFGDGGSGDGRVVTHRFLSEGTFRVTLEVDLIAASCPPPFNVCSDTLTQTVRVVAAGPPPLTASFSADVTCTGDSCFAVAGEEVHLTGSSNRGTGFAWDFGDDETASGEAVTHTWAREGEYTVTLTVQDGEDEASASRTFFMDPPPNYTSTVLLPWIADTTGALTQASDLYVTNPGNEPMEVTIEFRKRGLPENPAPASAPLPLPAHGSLYFPDVLDQLFGRSDTGGFLLVTAEEVTVDPVVVSLNLTRQSDGTTYGQMVPGITLPELDAAADGGGGRQYLLGLTDTDERHSYFGITNPHAQPAVYTLTLYDHLGELISGPSAELSVSGWGQKQFQIQELRDEFGVVGREDYRVEIDQISGETLYPYGGVIRQGTQDPSFVRVSVPNQARSYLVGAASTTGFNNAFFQTDAVISNPTGEVMQLDLVYRNVGIGNQAEAPQSLTLQPMETRRIEDVLFNLWGIETSVGVLTFDSTGADGLYPMIHGETYQNSGGESQFGLFMPARRDGEAAGEGQKVVFTGLRQLDGDSNTTVWLFNPSDRYGAYDLVYYDLEGAELGRMQDYRVGAGAIRQVNPSRHLLPAGGVVGGFTLEIHVLHGELIGGANVVINQSNDPAYVAGAVR